MCMSGPAVQLQGRARLLSALSIQGGKAERGEMAEEAGCSGCSLQLGMAQEGQTP